MDDEYNMNPSIEMVGVFHHFGNGSSGIKNIHLRIQSGELVVLAGPNGSGKTTLLRHINGLLTPNDGKVRVDGMDVRQNISLVRQRVGMVFQDADSQIVGETVYDDVAFGPENLRLKRSDIQKRVETALDAVGLSVFADRPPHLLSGGEKRRLAIAGILAMDANIILMDEPFSNLDYPGVKQVLEQILKIHSGGRTLIVATHDIEKIIHYADRLIIMNHGNIVLDDLPGQILQQVESFGVRMPCAVRLGAEVESWLN